MLQRGDGGRAQIQIAYARGRRWVQSTISSIRIGFNSSFSLKLCHNTLPSFVLTAKFEKFIYLFSNLCGKIIVIKSPISGLSRKKKKKVLLKCKIAAIKMKQTSNTLIPMLSRFLNIDYPKPIINTLKLNQNHTQN